jgi:hypothetical protein
MRTETQASYACAGTWLFIMYGGLRQEQLKDDDEIRGRGITSVGPSTARVFGTERALVTNLSGL